MILWGLTSPDSYLYTVLSMVVQYERLRNIWDIFCLKFLDTLVPIMKDILYFKNDSILDSKEDCYTKNIHYVVLMPLASQFEIAQQLIIYSAIVQRSRFINNWAIYFQVLANHQLAHTCGLFCNK